MHNTMIIPTFIILFTFLTAQAQDVNRKYPYSCLNVAQGNNLGAMRIRIRALKSLNTKDAEANCALAELLKRTGDYGAKHIIDER